MHARGRRTGACGTARLRGRGARHLLLRGLGERLALARTRARVGEGAMVGVGLVDDQQRQRVSGVRPRVAPRVQRTPQRRRADLEAGAVRRRVALGRRADVLGRRLSRVVELSVAEAGLRGALLAEAREPAQERADGPAAAPPPPVVIIELR